MTLSPVEVLAGSVAVEVFGLMLVHFLWQGAIAGLVTAGGLHLLRDASPNLRYGVACLGLAVLVSLPAATAVRLTSGQPVAQKAGGAVNATETARMSGEPVPSGEAAGPTSEPGAAAGSSSGETTSWWGEHRGRFLPWLVLGWLAGVLVLSLRHLGGWLHVRRRVLRRARPIAEAWQIRIERVRSRIGVSRAVRALVAEGLDTPVVIGWVRPVIVVPVGLLAGMPPAEVEALLAHELAHVKRLDYAINLLQTGAETLLFFHPAVWWISGQIRREREHCCDEMAAAACGSRETCARALAGLAVAGGRFARRVPAASGGTVVERIRRLSRPGSRRPTPGGWIGAAGVVLGVVLLSAASLVPVTSHGPSAMPAGGDHTTGSLAPPLSRADLSSRAGAPIVQPPARLRSLRERWRWAAGDAGRHDGAWIGWALSDVAGGTSVVSNSPGGPPHDGGPPLRSHLAGRWEGRSLPGAVVLVGLSGSRQRVAWVRLREPSMPTDLDGMPLYWLGSAENDESLERLGHLREASSDPGVRAELAAALSLHAPPDRVVPAVRRVLQSDPSELVRAEAVSWLERHPTASAARLLRMTAATDTSPLVREHALSSLEDYPQPEIQRWLAEFATESPDPRVRTQAARALGDRDGAEGVPVLERLVFEDRDRGVRQAALDALVDLERPRVERTLQRVAEDHPDPTLREQAREELADRVAS